MLLRRRHRKQTKPTDPIKRAVWDRFTRQNLRVKLRYHCKPVPAAEVIALYERLLPQTCFYCGNKLGAWNISVDHYVPLHNGGSHSAANFKFCCRRCNYYKAGLAPLEWEAILAALEAKNLLPFFFGCFRPKYTKSKVYKKLSREWKP